MHKQEVKRLIRDVECNDHYPLLILSAVTRAMIWELDVMIGLNSDDRLQLSASVCSGYSIRLIFKVSRA